MMKISQNAYFFGKMPFYARKGQNFDISASFWLDTDFRAVLEMHRISEYFNLQKFQVQQAIAESTETGTLNLKFKRK